MSKRKTWTTTVSSRDKKRGSAMSRASTTKTQLMLWRTRDKLWLSKNSSKSRTGSKLAAARVAVALYPSSAEAKSRVTPNKNRAPVLSFHQRVVP